MYCQLGTTVFDGLKSFVTFSSQEDAVIVEYALINRKPRLQGAGIGLVTLSITIFLHQEFCVVKDEIAKLRSSLEKYESLPLLWGNGTVEGNFVIVTLSRNVVEQDPLGNIIAAQIALTLKEFIVENTADSQQQQAQQNAFATGNKQPATKSNRVNPVACNAFVSKEMSLIRSAGADVDSRMQKYRVASDNNIYALRSVGVIQKESAKLLQATADSTTYPCLANKNASVTAAWNKINIACNGLQDTISSNDTTNTVNPDVASIDYYRVNLNAGIAQLGSAVTSNLQSNALRR